MKPNFQNILVNMLREKYPNTKFSVEGDKVTSDDNQFVAIADLSEEEGYGGVWVWDVDTGPYRGVLGNAIQEATTQFIRQNPSLKPALFVDGDNQNPEAWTAIAAKLGYTLIDEDFDFDEDTGNVETNSSMSTTSPSTTPSVSTTSPSPTPSVSTGAIGLGQGIRSAMAGGNISTTSVGTRSLGVAASNMAKNLQNNTDKIQKIVDEGDEETKRELAKLIKMMSDAQRMQGQKQTNAIRDVVSQVKVLSETSVDLADSLDLKQTLKDLKTGSIGSIIQESLNVDQGAGFFGTIKQAFEPSRMFRGGSFFGLGGERFARINREREFMARKQLAFSGGGLSSTIGSLGLDEPTPTTTLGTATQTTGRFQSGLDVLGEPQRQTILLEDILNELKRIREEGIPTSSASLPLLGSAIAGAVGAKLATLGRGIVAGLGALFSPAGLATLAITSAVGALYYNRDKFQEMHEDADPTSPAGARRRRRRNGTAETLTPSQQFENATGRTPTDQELAAFVAGETVEFDSQDFVTPGMTNEPVGMLTIGNQNTSSGSELSSEEKIQKFANENGYDPRQIIELRPGEFTVFDSVQAADDYRYMNQSSSSVPSNVLDASRLQSAVTPTGNALYNMTGFDPTAGGNTVVNNITNNNVATSSDNKPLLAVSPDSVRNTDSVVVRKENMRYMA